MNLDPIDTVIVQTYKRLTAKQQAQHLQLGYSSINKRRRKLSKLGLVRTSQRKYGRSWTPSEDARITQMLAAGKSIAAIAQEVMRSEAAVYDHIEKRLGGVNQLRSGKIWTLHQVQQLLRVAPERVRQWAQDGRLIVMRDNRRNAQSRITTDELLRFFHLREVWMDWSPLMIRDPYWRRAAEQARASIPGSWLSVSEIAHRYGYSVTAVHGWIHRGELKTQKSGRLHYVWSADLEGFVPPMGRKR